jgi:hypothetical protein
LAMRADAREADPWVKARHRVKARREVNARRCR